MTGCMHTFYWRGEPIRDIREWAARRGERMVIYHGERQCPNPYTGQLDIETDDGEMPESFWNSLHMSNGWVYREVQP